MNRKGEKANIWRYIFRGKGINRSEGEPVKDFGDEWRDGRSERWVLGRG